MKKLKLSLYFLFVFFSFSHAQKIRCASDIRISENHELHQKVNEKIEQFKTANLKTGAKTEILRIPVVVHVIHNNSRGIIGGNDNSNISEEQIFSQIEVLNEDYRRKSGTPGFSNHPASTDMEMEFFLANIDPNGNPSSGINRVYSPRRSFSVYSDLKALSDLSYWDSNRYLNIWVTNLSSSILGYAEFPIGSFDGLETMEIDEKTDGVFVDHSCFGRQTGTANDGYYDKGRTVTHEIGHWFGLIHTWGDTYCGTDFCEDTPTIEAANKRLDCDIVYSRCRLNRVENMIENYMDYSVDACMSVFTNDQKSRVRAILEISQRRKNLINNLDFFKPIEEDILVKIMGNPTNNSEFHINVFVNEPKDYSIEIFDELGRKLFQDNYSKSFSRAIKIPKSELGAGIKYLKVTSGKNVINQKLVSF